MTKKKIEKLAYEIRQFLLDRQLWVDVTIYFNGMALSTDDRNGHYGYNKDVVYLHQNMNPRDYFDYVGDILSMSFEGDFYDVLNYGAMPKVYEEFVELLGKYGLHFELGNAWNLSLFSNY